MNHYDDFIDFDDDGGDDDDHDDDDHDDDDDDDGNDDDDDDYDDHDGYCVIVIVRILTMAVSKYIHKHIIFILFISLVGTAGNIVWKLRCIGKLFHSGLPHKGINSIEFGMDTITYLQQQFYNDYPRHEKENEYSYLTSSNFKPTQISCSSGALNQLPAECIIQGDLRLTPFYDINDVKIKIESYINNINQNPSILQQPENCNIIHGPQSKYILDNSPSNSNGEGDVEKARIELTWLSSGENGVACKLDSIGYKAIIEATKKVLGT